MIKKILIIGFGSIGEKHFKVLNKLSYKTEILVYTKRKKLKINFTNSLYKVIDFNPDFIFVCSETNRHLNHIEFINKHFRKKIVLIEKPIFHKNINTEFKNNLYLVGYNLRFHPVILFIKKKIKKLKTFSVKISCSSYLPDWRPNRDYSKTYSSIKKAGGGVLLDLSHEFDYLQWLFGKITKIEKIYIDKISNLKINVEDISIILGKIKKIFFNININFFSKVNERIIIIDAANYTIKGNLLESKVEIFNKNKNYTYNFSKQSMLSYLSQDRNLLSQNFKNFCNLKRGKELLKLIEFIKNAKK